jgi:hypothetical protein
MPGVSIAMRKVKEVYHVCRVEVLAAGYAPGPERARVGGAEGLPRHPADRRVRRLQERGGVGRHGRRDGRRCHAGALLSTLPSAVFRHRQSRAGAIAMRCCSGAGIGALYEIEAEIRGKSAAERQAARQLRSKPLIEALKRWNQNSITNLRPQKSRFPMHRSG